MVNLGESLYQELISQRYKVDTALNHIDALYSPRTQLEYIEYNGVSLNEQYALIRTTRITLHEKYRNEPR